MFKRDSRNQRPRDKAEKLFDSKLVDLSRVTRVTGGGKRMSFRACMIIGDRKGNVGLGIAKGKDVAQAVEKSTRYAKRAMFFVPTVNDGTIPHDVHAKVGASQIILKPQAKGRGIVAGGAARIVLSLAGVRNVTAKFLGTTKNKLNNARVTIDALKQLKGKQVKVDKKPAFAVATEEAKPATENLE